MTRRAAPFRHFAFLARAARALAALVGLLAGSHAVAATDFLPPEQAYEYVVQAADGALNVSLNIRSGYFLYRNRFAFATTTPGVTLGEPVYPKGLSHRDDYFGEQEIYRGTPTIRVPYRVDGSAPAAIDLKLQLQGCADAGLCYPPQHWIAHVALPAGNGPGHGDALSKLLKQAHPADDGFLPVDEAYRATLEPGSTPQELQLRIAIADGYYLYRDKLTVAATDPAATVAAPALPAGQPHDDEYFGHREVYRQLLEASVPLVTPPAAGGSFKFSVTYQGCADAGLCYPPQTRVLSVTLPPAAPGGATAAPAATSLPLLAVVALAVLGGLLLNLMPCVLPVLSIKAVSLAAAADSDAAGTRAKGLAFTMGVLVSMLALASALLALRAAGQQIGWGFQLQSPHFVLGLCYLLLLVGLNLSGVFEFGAALSGVGDDLTRGDSLRATFFTGVLTTLVATPCTAPFMATAVGVALTQSAGVALLVFAAIGLGLALPYLLLSVAPALRHLLPRPGRWMNHFRQALAFPMYLSAGWLLWVLAQQSSSELLAVAIVGIILVAFAAWCYELARTGSGVWRYVSATLALAALATALIAPWRLPAQAAGAPASATSTDGDWQRFDAARVSELVAAGHPVFVVFTADWCVTCKVNEHVAIDNDAVEQLFRDKGVIRVKADWTRSDPAISAELARRGRGGVPLYLWYRPGVATPEILPQVLTPGLLQSLAGALDRATPRAST